MREILFRAKCKEDGDWIYGDLLHDGIDYDVAIWEQKYKLVTAIQEETVGQFTGLTDKNGKKIFEGDIVRIFSQDYIGIDEMGKVEFKDGCFGVSYFPEWEREYSFGGWHFHRIGEIGEWREMGASGKIYYTYEVIGNINDNPELLEGVMKDEP